MRDGDEDAADDFENFHEAEEAGGIDRANEHGRG